MSYEALTFEKKNGYAIITLNCPQSMNALEAKLLAELTDATNRVANDNDISAAVLTGSGKAFCAGGDLRRLMEGFSPLGGQQYVKDIHSWLLDFVNLDKPVIAAVNGFAVGAGFCIALLCDIVLAAEDAKFGQAFVNVGLVPDLAGMYFLPRIVGLQKAKELIFTGEQIHADKACQLGIVNEVLPADQLLPEAERLAGQLAAGPKVALSLAKRILNMSTNLSLESLLELESLAQGLCFQTEDHKEAVKAFLEKRRPAFKGI